MIINFNDLKRIVNDNIIEVFDHHFINDLDIMQYKIPTCENIIDIIWNLLDHLLNDEGVVLEKLKLYETPTSYSEVIK